MQLKRIRQLVMIAAVVVTGLALSSAVSADDRIRGVITERGNDGSITVGTDDASSIVVALGDTTKVRRLDGARSMKMSSSVLIPGLRVEVAGRYDSSTRFIAERVTFSRKDLKLARAIQAGVTPTDERSAANQQQIEQHAKALQQHGATIARQGQQLETQKGQIAANGERIAATAGTLEARIANLDDFNVIGSVTVLFPNGKATIAPKYKAQLQQMASQAMGTTAYVIKIQGYASAVGGAELNQELSLKRSVAVTAILQQSGVDPAKLVVPAAMGTTEQVASNKTAKGQAENRRAVVTLMQNKGISGK